MIQLKDYTNGRKPKYYIISELGSYAYPNKEMLNAWIEFHSNINYKSGNIEDLESFELVTWEIADAKLKQQPEQMREITNTKGI